MAAARRLARRRCRGCAARHPRSPRQPNSGTGRDVGTRTCCAVRASRLRWIGETHSEPDLTAIEREFLDASAERDRTRSGNSPNAPPATSATTGGCGGPSPAQACCWSSRSSAAGSRRCGAVRPRSPRRTRASRRSWRRRCRSSTTTGRRLRCSRRRPTGVARRSPGAVRALGGDDEHGRAPRRPSR